MKKYTFTMPATGSVTYHAIAESAEAAAAAINRGDGTHEVEEIDNYADCSPDYLDFAEDVPEAGGES